MIQAQGNQTAIPLLSRLIFQQLRHAIRPDARRQARRRQRQQGRMRVAGGRACHRMDGERARKTNGFDAERRLGERLARRGRVAFVEHQEQRRAHRFGTIGQDVGRRRLDRDVGGFELLAGAHEALGDRRGRAQESRRDLRHREAAHGLERKRHPHLRRQRRMTDREQQRQFVVVQLAVEAAFPFDRHGSDGHQLGGQQVAARLAAQKIERAVPGDGRQPGFGPVGNALERPEAERLQKCVLHGILGHGDAAGAEPPCQGRDQPARRIAGERIDEPVDGGWQGVSRRPHGPTSCPRSGALPPSWRVRAPDAGTPGRSPRLRRGPSPR